MPFNNPDYQLSIYNNDINNTIYNNIKRYQVFLRSEPKNFYLIGKTGTKNSEEIQLVFGQILFQI